MDPELKELKAAWDDLTKRYGEDAVAAKFGARRFNDYARSQGYEVPRTFGEAARSALDFGKGAYQKYDNFAAEGTRRIASLLGKIPVAGRSWRDVADRIETDYLAEEYKNEIPTSKAQAYGQVLGQFLNEGAQVYTTGAIGRGVTGIGRAGQVAADASLGAKIKGGLKAATQDAAFALPIDLGAAALGAEESTLGGFAQMAASHGSEKWQERFQKLAENPVTRTLGEIAPGFGGDIAIRGATGIAKGGAARVGAGLDKAKLRFGKSAEQLDTSKAPEYMLAEDPDISPIDRQVEGSFKDIEPSVYHDDRGVPQELAPIQKGGVTPTPNPGVRRPAAPDSYEPFDWGDSDFRPDEIDVPGLENIIERPPDFEIDASGTPRGRPTPKRSAEVPEGHRVFEEPKAPPERFDFDGPLPWIDTPDDRALGRALPPGRYNQPNPGVVLRKGSTGTRTDVSTEGDVYTYEYSPGTERISRVGPDARSGMYADPDIRTTKTEEDVVSDVNTINYTERPSRRQYPATTIRETDLDQTPRLRDRNPDSPSPLDDTDFESLADEFVASRVDQTKGYGDTVRRVFLDALVAPEPPSRIDLQDALIEQGIPIGPGTRLAEEIGAARYIYDQGRRRGRAATAPRPWELRGEPLEAEVLGPDDIKGATKRASDNAPNDADYEEMGTALPPGPARNPIDEIESRLAPRVKDVKRLGRVLRSERPFANGDYYRVLIEEGFPESAARKLGDEIVKARRGAKPIDPRPLDEIVADLVSRGAGTEDQVRLRLDPAYVTTYGDLHMMMGTAAGTADPRVTKRPKDIDLTPEVREELAREMSDLRAQGVGDSGRQARAIASLEAMEKKKQKKGKGKKKGDEGFLAPELSGVLGGSSLGAATGAALDDENRLRGAAIGGAVGGGLGVLAGAKGPRGVKRALVERRVSKELMNQPISHHASFDVFKKAFRELGYSKDDASSLASDASRRFKARRQRAAALGELDPAPALQTKKDWGRDKPHDAYGLGDAKPTIRVPDESYHATYSKGKILRTGLKTGTEAGNTGLGGTPDLVSVTQSREAADLIADAFREAHELLNMPPREAVERLFKEGAEARGAEQPYFREAGGKGIDHPDIQALMNGRKFVRGVIAESELPKDAVGVLEYNGRSKDGERFFLGHEVPISDDEIAARVMELYGQFSTSRGWSGGRKDPLFMFAREAGAKLKNTDPDDIGVLTVRPKNDRILGKGVGLKTHVPEFRTWSGKGLKVDGQSKLSWLDPEIVNAVKQGSMGAFAGALAGGISEGKEGALEGAMAGGLAGAIGPRAWKNRNKTGKGFNFRPKGGFATPELSNIVGRPLVGAGVGGWAGAEMDSDNPRRGFVAGAAIGGALGAGSAVRSLDAPRVSTGSKIGDKVLKTISLTGQGRQKAVSMLSEFTPSRVRAGVFRSINEAEKFGRAIFGDDRLAHEAARGRGWAAAAGRFIMDDFRYVVGFANEAGIEKVRALTKQLRERELRSQGRPKMTELSDADLDQGIKELSADPKVRKAASALRNYYRRLLEMKLENGVIGREEFERIVAKGEFYIPFVRDLEGGDVFGRTGMLSESNNVRSMGKGEGGDAKTIDPFAQAIEDTLETYQTIAKQRLTNMVGKAVEGDPAKTAPWIKPLKGNEVGRGPSGELRLRDGEVSVIVNGERKYFQIVDEDLARSLAAQEAAVGGAAVEIANKLRGLKQYGVTITPAFQLANASRDLVASGLQAPLNVRGAFGGSAVGAGMGASMDEDSRGRGALLGASVGFGGGHFASHGVNVVRALSDILGSNATGGILGGAIGGLSGDEDDSQIARMLMGIGAGVGAGKLVGKKGNQAIYQKFLEEGGGGFGFFAREPKDFAKLVKRMETDGVDPRDVLTWRRPIDAIDIIGRAIETAPRLAEYKRNLAAGKTSGEAIFKARDLSVDFSVSGGWKATKTLNKVVPFYNPALQGLDKLGRMYSNPKTWGMTAATVLAPTLALFEINKDNDEYWALPLYQRNLYWHVPKPQGGFFKIPKPFEVGAVWASLPERIMEYEYQRDPETLKTAAENLWAQYGIGSFVPTPVGFEVVEAGMDRDTFRNRPINPEQYAPIDDQFQYDEQTSTIAVKAAEGLGKAGIDVSPAKIDHVLKSMAGSLGASILDASSKTARKIGIDDRGEPLGRFGGPFGRFHSNRSQTPEQELSFRRKYIHSRQAYNTANRLKEQAERGGSWERYQRYVRDNESRLVEYAALDQIEKYMKPYRDQRRAIIEDTSLPPRERRRLMEELNADVEAAFTEIFPPANR